MDFINSFDNVSKKNKEVTCNALFVSREGVGLDFQESEFYTVLIKNSLAQRRRRYMAFVIPV